MQYSPIAMPQSPAAPAQEPNDILAWLKKALLGGQDANNTDSSQTDLLSSLLATKMTGAGDGTTH